jgi:hypothetical protein
MTAVKTVVAYCMGCRYWVTAAEIGRRCIGDGTCRRTLVRRVGFLCAARGLHRRARDARGCEDDHDG